jgi:hypothetical protein
LLTAQGERATEHESREFAIAGFEVLPADPRTGRVAQKAHPGAIGNNNAGRARISHQLALGVSLKTAIQHGVSSKSYWHMARTPAMPHALNNDWLQGQGVPSIKKLWCKAQGYSS